MKLSSRRPNVLKLMVGFAVLTFAMITAIGVAGCAAEATEISPQKARKGEQEFTGEYQWSQGGSDTLVVSFKPTGEDRWKVKFRFAFDGRNNTWKGKAEGSLAEGSKVSGTVRGGGSREWRFEGAVVGDVLTAKHFEFRDGQLLETGTFEVSR